MTLFRRLLLFTSVFLCSTAIYCQDKIYLQNSIIQGKITEITPTELKYLPLEKSGTALMLPLSKALILVNGRGMVLVPAKEDPGNPSMKDLVAGFLSPDSNHIAKDQLFTMPRNKVEGTITKEDKYAIYLSDGTKVDKKSLVALIYSNGQSMIYGPTDQAAVLLGSFQEEAVRAHASAAPPVSAAATPADISSAPTPVTAGPPAADTTLVAQKAAADSAQALTFATLAKGVSKKEFEEKAEKKTTQFTEYLKILCDKTAGFEELNKAIAQTLTLFVNENAIIETSSNNRNNVSSLKIRDYLLKVKKLQYDKIEIEWTHVQYVSDLKPGPDGNFYGVVSFEQVFRGYRDGKLVYSDITRKNATVVLKTYQKSIEGSTTSVWDVLLSDVGVISTKAL
ncbi:MAG TPA: hypothetical protein VL832_15480 [Puia sp.]|jgi:hypothetical protein|nr:hypothetical protein [Puia sp.]